MDTRAPAFVGLDLAWSSRNRTGGAVIQNGCLLASDGLLTDNESILAFVAAHVPKGAPAVVAVDAPLRVPNLTGRRECDHRVSVEWGRYQAGAYPANRTLLAYDGVIRGEVIADLLHHRFGFVETAPIPQRGTGRYLCEVFPHPAHVALFSLEQTLKYKRKPGRTQAMVYAQYARYQTLLATLTTAEPPLVGLETVTSRSVIGLRGQALHAVEETLDAITCAYVAYFVWWHGPARQLVYGSIADGHILIPLPPAMAVRLRPDNGV
jgi:predicted RNase H-like nuclease